MAHHAIVQTLALLGLTGDTPAPPAPAFQLLDLVDVVDRQHAGDRFVRDWSSFDAVRAGDPIGIREDGTVVAATEDGHMVFRTRAPRRAPNGSTSPAPGSVHKSPRKRPEGVIPLQG